MNSSLILKNSIYALLLCIGFMVQAQERAGYAKTLRAEKYLVSQIVMAAGFQKPSKYNWCSPLSFHPTIALRSIKKDDIWTQCSADMKDPFSQKSLGNISYNYRQDKNISLIQLLHVEPAHRKKGYGKKLVKYALNDLQRAGCTEAYLLASPYENDRNNAKKGLELPQLISFYQDCGGKVTQKHPTSANMKFDLAKKDKPKSLRSHSIELLMSKLPQSLNETQKQKEMERYYDYQ